MRTAKPTALSPRSLSLICSQAALLLQAGIPLSSGLSDLAADGLDQASQQALSRVDEALLQGLSFSAALRQAQSFPPYMLEMTELAETAGRLEEVMDTLGRYYGRMDIFSQRLRSAVLYPSILIAVMAVVIAVMLTLVLPVFQQVFQQLSGGLSAAALESMTAGLSVSRWVLALLLVLLAAMGLAALIYKLPRCAAAFARFGSRFFLTRRLLSRLGGSRFVGAMELVVKSGIPPQQAVELAMGVLDHGPMRQRLEQQLPLLQQTGEWERALESAGVISGLDARLLRIGRETGAVDQVLEQIAQRSDDDAVESLNGLLSAVEPALVSLLAVVIGSVMISVMLPLLQVLTAIG